MFHEHILSGNTNMLESNEPVVIGVDSELWTNISNGYACKSIPLIPQTSIRVSCLPGSG
jgi:hypothetical protein